jgi:sugar phosphate isomerase/epimerase
MFEQIKEANYEGVEIFQHPEDLGSAEQLHTLLTSLNLTFLGLAGGSLAEKIKFIRTFFFCEQRATVRGARSGAGSQSPRPLSNYQPYAYVDEWDCQRSQDTLQDGYVLALHPHMFRSVQTVQEAEAWLAQHPRLRFLPDTAHLTVAGEDVVEVLERNFDRIDAIHLKDWTAEFGRAYQFYSRGFVELGRGDVRLNEILRYLKDRDYRGWLVVEQDSSEAPSESAFESREWLRREYQI